MIPVEVNDQHPETYITSVTSHLCAHVNMLYHTSSSPSHGLCLLPNAYGPAVHCTQCKLSLARLPLKHRKTRTRAALFANTF